MSALSLEALLGTGADDCRGSHLVLADDQVRKRAAKTSRCPVRGAFFDVH